MLRCGCRSRPRSGYKQAKYLMTLSVVDELGAEKSYWGDQGYSWYGGI